MGSCTWAGFGARLADLGLAVKSYSSCESSRGEHLFSHTARLSSEEMAAFLMERRPSMRSQMRASRSGGKSGVAPAYSELV